jgi:hypothetical protein
LCSSCTLASCLLPAGTAWWAATAGMLLEPCCPATSLEALSARGWAPWHQGLQAGGAPHPGGLAAPWPCLGRGGAGHTASQQQPHASTCTCHPSRCLTVPACHTSGVLHTCTSAHARTHTRTLTYTQPSAIPVLHKSHLAYNLNLRATDLATGRRPRPLASLRRHPLYSACLSHPPPHRPLPCTPILHAATACMLAASSLQACRGPPCTSITWHRNKTRAGGQH